MQTITPEGLVAIEEGKQVVVPRVLVEWQNSKSITGLNAFSSSDDYLNKTTDLDPDVFLRNNDNRYAKEVIADAPVAYYKLDELTGSFYFDSQPSTTFGDSDAALTAGVRLGYPSMVDPSGACSYHDGVSTTGAVSHDYLYNRESGGRHTIGNTRNSNLTVECWVKLDQVGVWQWLVSKGDMGNNWALYVYTTNQIIFGIGNNNTIIYSNAVLAINTWYHIVGTWDGIKFVLYINGKVDKTTFQPKPPGYTTSNEGLFIGAPQLIIPTSTKAFIDEVAVYNTCLPAERVQTHYAIGAKEIYDYSEHSRTGTLNSYKISSTTQANYNTPLLDNFSKIDFTTSQPASFSHTLGGGKNRIVCVSVFYENAGATATPSVTYNGVAMTSLGVTTVTSTLSCGTYYLLESSLPVAGTYTVAATLLSTTGLLSGTVHAISYYNVSQVAPTASATSNASFTREQTVSVTPTANGTLILCFSAIDGTPSNDMRYTNSVCKVTEGASTTMQNIVGFFTSSDTLAKEFDVYTTPVYAGKFVNVSLFLKPALTTQPTSGFSGQDQIYVNTPYFYLNGAYAWTADSAALSITSDLDIRCKAYGNWAATSMMLVSKWEGTTQKSYRLWMDSGTIKLELSTAGTATITKSVASGFAAGSYDKWVRATFDADNGAGGYDIKFYSSDDGIYWTQLGATVTTATPITIFNSTARLTVGASFDNGSDTPLTGRVYYAEVRSGINGTIVASPTFSAQAAGTGSFTDALANSWTVPSSNILSSNTDTSDNGYFNYTDNFTVEAWANMYVHPGNGNRSTVLEKGSAATPLDGQLWKQYGIDFIGTSGSVGSTTATTQLQAYVWVGTTRKSVNSSNISAGKWYYTTMVIKSGTMYFYVNGVLQGSISLGGNANVTSGKLYIGAVGAKDDTYFDSGTSGGHMYAVDSTATSVTGDIDLRVGVAAADYTPASQQCLIAKNETTGNQRSYRFEITTGGNLILTWSANGTAELSGTSTATLASVGITDGIRVDLRAVLDVDNGAAGKDVKFYWKWPTATTWTQLGTTVTTGTTTSIFNSTARTTVGAFLDAGTSDVFVGKIYYAEVYNVRDSTSFKDCVFGPRFDTRSLNKYDNAAFVDGAGNSIISLSFVAELKSTAVSLNNALSGLVSDVAIYDGVVMFEDEVYARYMSGAKSSAYKATLFSPDEIFNGLDGLNFVWAGPDIKTTKNQTLMVGENYHPIENIQSDKSYKYEYGWMSANTSDGSGLFSNPEIVTAQFDDIEANYLRVSIPTQYSGISKFRLWYLSDADVWTQVGSTWQFLSGVSTLAINLNSTLTIRGIKIKVDSTQNINDRAKILEVAPLILDDVSDDIVNIEIKKVKEEYDSSVPFGATAANSLDFTLQDVNLKYNVKNTLSDVSQYMVEDVPLTVELGWEAAGGSNGLSLDGTSGAYVSTPDSAHLSIVGDIDLRAYLAMADWTPAATSTIVNKWTTSGNLKSYALQITTGGNLRLLFSANGSTTVTKDSTAAVSFTNGAAGYIRATLDVDNGAAGYDVKFYTSTDGTNWTQLGSTVTTATATSIYDGTAALIVGGLDVGVTERPTATIYSVEVRSGIGGTIVADPDFLVDPENYEDTTISDGINIYTLNGTAAFLSGGIEYFKQGTYYVDTWTTETSGMTTTVQARDASKYLQEANGDDGYVSFDVAAAEAISNIARVGGVKDSQITVNKPYSDTIMEDLPDLYYDFSAASENNLSFKFSYDTFAGTATNVLASYPRYMSPFYSPTSTAFSVMFWMKTTQNPGGGTWVDIVNFAKSGTLKTFNVQMGTSGAMRYVKNGTNGASQAMGMNDGKWHHFAITFTGTSAPIFYKDGKQFSTDATVAANTTLDRTTLTLGSTINTWPGTWDAGSFVGNIDNFTVFDSQISDPGYWASREITSYETPNLWLSYRFSEGYTQGTTQFLNYTENEHHYTRSDINPYDKFPLYKENTTAFVLDKVNVLMDKASGLNATPISMTSYANTSPITSEKHYSFGFNGTSDYAIIPAISSILPTNKVTLEAWVYKDSTGTGTRNIVHKSAVGSVTTNSLSWGIDTNNKIYLERASTDSSVSGTAIDTDEWVHIAVVLDRTVSNTPKFYINGALDTVAATGSIGGNFETAVEPVLIGTNANGGQFWKGYIASLAWWVDALTDAQITNHYNASISPLQKKFNALWANEDNPWSSMLTISLADLGMFFFDENNDFKYESAKNFYNSAYEQFTISQHDLDESTNIENAQQVVELQVNKVNVKVNPSTTRSATKSEIWSAPENESLAATKLSQELLSTSFGDDAIIYFETIIDESGIRQPVFLEEGYVRIDDEIIKYDSADESRLIGLTRGQFNTATRAHSSGTFVGEARRYFMEWSESVLFASYPFITAQIYDATVDVNLWHATPKGAELVISLTSRFDSKNKYQLLNSATPASGIANFFVVAGIPSQVQNATGNVSETSLTFADKIRKYGIKEITIDNPFIQDQTYARTVAEFVLDKNDNLVPILEIETLGIPQLQLGDRITIVAFDQMSIENIDYWVQEINISYDGGVKQSMILREVDL